MRRRGGPFERDESRGERFSTRIRVKWLLSPLRRARAYWLASLRLGLHTDRRDPVARVCAPPHVFLGAHTRMYTRSLARHNTPPPPPPPPRRYRTCIIHACWYTYVRHAHAAPEFLRPRQPRAHVSARRTAERRTTRLFLFSFSPRAFRSFPPSASRLLRGRLERGWRFDRIDREDQRAGAIRESFFDALSLGRVLIAG